MPHVLDRSRFLDHIRAAGEVYAPGCAGHSLLFEQWLQSEPEASAGTRYSGVQIPTVNRFDFAGLHPQARQRTIFLSAELRESWLAGRVDYLPMTYSATWRWLREVARFDVALVQVAPPDAHGNCSLGIACDFTPAAWPRARVVLAHINPLMPRTHGPSIPYSAITAAIEAEAPLLEVPDPPADPAMDAVARQVAGLIGDGATLQLGLGRLQSAVLRAVADRRGLRIHSGMVSDGLLGLYESGALADAADAVVSGVALGSQALYRACGQIQFREVGHTHAAATLAGIDSLHAINSALSVDLLGQVNGEFLSGRQMSGVGGLPDFIAGARQSAAGRGIIALPASTPKGQCRIVPMLPTGPVSLARVDADCIVTEHGVADLRHLDVHQRAAALIAIAAPEHREQLRSAWHELSRTL
ncbi:acetyl-CoA hydrolase [Stenotrophomonas sp. W1S232]|uniref:Acetyl-CoA hydrolase n=1 Tax=Stenotrophomonas koreensis TaxID=266128 RepID=A0A7W3V124_9GAMM|nr:acetyl-CoA hydrolase/transferase C-terminal domain-containing protein [Stenotrophomonas koreensis]MBB1117461.1 acetyl-CoA hydrolase [Stenotrophomonas koreensis]